MTIWTLSTRSLRYICFTICRAAASVMKGCDVSGILEAVPCRITGWSLNDDGVSGAA